MRPANLADLFHDVNHLRLKPGHLGGVQSGGAQLGRNSFAPGLQLPAAQDTKKALANRPGLSLLGTCLSAGFDPADAAATQAFVASQPPATQSLLASLLLGRPPASPLAIAKESLLNLRR
ncbi:MAG: hypothetical protein ACKOEI_09800, partial [Chthoniobacterales bacterium]